MMAKMNFTRRQVLQYGSISTSAIFLAACEDDNKKVAKNVDLTEEQLAFSSGKADAPLILQEFLSLTCSHCARFHTDSFPTLKEKFIDDGKLLLVYRDFPLDGMALRGAMLARALPPQQGVKLQSILLEKQRQWANQNGDLTQLKNFARLAGMSPKQVDDTLADQDLMNRIVASRQNATEEYGVEATPSFTIGKDLFGGGSFEDIIDWVDGYIT